MWWIEMVNVIEDNRNWWIKLSLQKKQCPYRYYPANIIGCKNPLTPNEECNMESCPYRVKEFPATDPLVVLEEWVKSSNCGGAASNYVYEICGSEMFENGSSDDIFVEMIKHIRDHTSEVVKRGIEEDWCGWPWK
jgi:hypothetical protein